MYKKPSKKKQLVRLTVTYTLMAVAVVLIVTALIFVTLGYQFNRKDGKIEQGGLVQFDSKPGGAKVTIDGKAFAFNTASKTTLPSGKHTIEMSRDKYLTWKRDIYVRPSSVTWLNYARLIPSTLKPEYLTEYSGLTDSRLSTNRKVMAVVTSASANELTLVNVDGDVPKSTKLVLPANVLTTVATKEDGAPQVASLRIIKWDATSRYVLATRIYDEAQPAEWIVIDTRDVAQSKNLNSLLGIKPANVQFSIGDEHILYGLVDGSLRKINLNDATLSRPLITNIEEYDQFDRATIVYKTKLDPNTKSRSVGYYTDNAKTARTLKSYADDGTMPLRLRVGKYYDERYFAYLYGETLEIVKGDLPASDSTGITAYKPVVQMTIPGSGDHMTFSPNGRYVVVQKGANFTSFDIEIGETYTKTVAGDARPDELKWLDEMTLTSDRDGRMRTYEVDGLNPRDLGTNLTGQAYGYSSDGKYLYYFANNSVGVPSLTRERLILP